jgi:hypothetical protein
MKRSFDQSLVSIDSMPKPLLDHIPKPLSVVTMREKMCHCFLSLLAKRAKAAIR